MATWEECNKPIAPITPPPRPSGGDSNLVRGTFTGTEQGAMEVEIPYTGDGYPIGLLISFKDGYAGKEYEINTNNTILFSVWKYDMSLEPDYDGSGNDDGYTLSTYTKTSSSYTASGSYLAFTANNANPLGTNPSTVITIKDNKTLGVYIAPSSGSGRGFMPNVEFEYVVIYADKVDKTAKVDSAIVDTSEVG